MARIYGLNGLIRGRQGNNVFSIQNGTQVLKVYNPSISNPRTTAQRQQRAKFSLAGRLSSVTPRLALSGMIGGNARDKRARFVKTIVNNATVTGSDDNLTASVAFTGIKFSDGALQRWSQYAAAVATFANTLVTVDVPAMVLQPAAPAGYGEMLVVGIFDREGHAIEEIQVGFRSVDAASQFIFRDWPGFYPATVGVWVCPFVTESAISRGVPSDLFPTDTTAINLRVAASTTLAGYEWGNSQVLNVLAVTQSQSNALSPDVDRGDGEQRSVNAKKK